MGVANPIVMVAAVHQQPEIIMPDSSQQTIRDFGQQWKRYTKNEGYYASVELFKDFCGLLISPGEIQGKRILDVGSGTGRIVNMLLGMGARHVFAVEPSEAFSALQTNTQPDRDKVTCLNMTGEKIPNMKIDLAVSFGVLHHIPDPKPVVDRVYQVLPKGGKFIIWLYGREGNEKYLALFNPIHRITKALPDFALELLATILTAFMSFYGWLCKYFNLAMKEYVGKVFLKMDWHARKVIIFDQLNPAYAKYYQKNEAIHLLESSGFQNVKIFHRHAYSWTALGEK